MKSLFLRFLCGLLPAGLLLLAASLPAMAAELPYRQMARDSLHCQQIKDKRQSQRCRRKASAPIHATCRKQKGQNRKACYQRLGGKLRAAIAAVSRNRLKKN